MYFVVLHIHIIYHKCVNIRSLVNDNILVMLKVFGQESVQKERQIWTIPKLILHMLWLLYIALKNKYKRKFFCNARSLKRSNEPSIA